MKKLTFLLLFVVLAFANYAQITIFVDFENGVENQNVNIQGWQNIPTEGTRVFIYKTYNQNKYAQATAFGDSNNDETNVMWLITPAITVSQSSILTFKTAYGYYKHDPAHVMVSTNFVSDPTAATWTELTYNKPQNPSSTGYTNLQDGASGDVSLAQWAGQTIRIAFKYVGSKPAGLTTTWQIDDINITGITGLLSLSSGKISVYPNPATDYITISSFDKGKVEIFNAIGVKVLESESDVIDVKGLPKGMYLVTMQNDGQTYVSKFLKK